MTLSNYLQTHALFGGLSDASMERIVPMLKEESFVAGDFIVREGDDGDRMYFICEGSVEVLKLVTTPTGKENRPLAVLGVGDAFGEMHLIDVQRRSASVRALEFVLTVTLSNRDMYRLHKIDPEAFTMMIMNMAREISRRLRRMDEMFGTYSWGLDKTGSPDHIGPVHHDEPVSRQP